MARVVIPNVSEYVKSAIRVDNMGNYGKDLKRNKNAAEKISQALNVADSIANNKLVVGAIDAYRRSSETPDAPESQESQMASLLAADDAETATLKANAIQARIDAKQKDAAANQMPQRPGTTAPVVEQTTTQVGNPLQAPVAQAPVQVAQPTQTQVGPALAPVVQQVPAQAAPVQAAPVQAAPVQAAPAQAAPTAPAPVPVQAAPARTTYANKAEDPRVVLDRLLKQLNSTTDPAEVERLNQAIHNMLGSMPAGTSTAAPGNPTAPEPVSEVTPEDYQTVRLEQQVPQDKFLGTSKTTTTPPTDQELEAEVVSIGDKLRAGTATPAERARYGSLLEEQGRRTRAATAAQQAVPAPSAATPTAAPTSVAYKDLPTETLTRLQTDFAKDPVQLKAVQNELAKRQAAAPAPKPSEIDVISDMSAGQIVSGAEQANRADANTVQLHSPQSILLAARNAKTPEERRLISMAAEHVDMPATNIFEALGIVPPAGRAKFAQQVLKAFPSAKSDAAVALAELRFEQAKTLANQKLANQQEIHKARVKQQGVDAKARLELADKRIAAAQAGKLTSAQRNRKITVLEGQLRVNQWDAGTRAKAQRAREQELRNKTPAAKRKLALKYADKDLDALATERNRLRVEERKKDATTLPSIPAFRARGEDEVWGTAGENYNKEAAKHNKEVVARNKHNAVAKKLKDGIKARREQLTRDEVTLKAAKAEAEALPETAPTPAEMRAERRRAAAQARLDRRRGRKPKPRAKPKAKPKPASKSAEQERIDKAVKDALGE